LTASNVIAKKEGDGDGSKSMANAAIAAIAGLAQGGEGGSHVPLRAEEIHPFRVLKQAPTEGDSSKIAAVGGSPVAATETFSMKQKENTPELMKYFDRQETKNAARRQQKEKMAVGAQKRQMRQQQEQQQDMPPQTHPHLLAFLQEQLAEEAMERQQQTQLIALEQVASSTNVGGGGAAPEAASSTAAPAATPPSTGTGTTGGQTPATPTVAGTGGTGAPAPAPAASTTDNTPASPAASTPINTGGVLGESSTASDQPVVNSVVPLAHLQELQSELSDVEAEHAKRQAELNAELAQQQQATKDLLAQEKQGTVGLTVTPILTDPEKHVPIDPMNAQLYGNAPTDPNMDIRPSDFSKANDLISKESSQHTEFAHNMPILCAEPTCTVDQ